MESPAAVVQKLSQDALPLGLCVLSSAEDNKNKFLQRITPSITTCFERPVAVTLHPNWPIPNVPADRVGIIFIINAADSEEKNALFFQEHCPTLEKNSYVIVLIHTAKDQPALTRASDISSMLSKQFARAHAAEVDLENPEHCQKAFVGAIEQLLTLEEAFQIYLSQIRELCESASIRQQTRAMQQFLKDFTVLSQAEFTNSEAVFRLHQLMVGYLSNPFDENKDSFYQAIETFVMKLTRPLQVHASQQMQEFTLKADAFDPTSEIHPLHTEAYGLSNLVIQGLYRLSLTPLRQCQWQSLQRLFKMVIPHHPLALRLCLPRIQWQMWRKCSSISLIVANMKTLISQELVDEALKRKFVENTIKYKQYLAKHPVPASLIWRVGIIGQPLVGKTQLIERWYSGFYMGNAKTHEGMTRTATVRDASKELDLFFYEYPKDNKRPTVALTSLQVLVIVLDSQSDLEMNLRDFHHYYDRFRAENRTARVMVIFSKTDKAARTTPAQFQQAIARDLIVYCDAMNLVNSCMEQIKKLNSKLLEMQKVKRNLPQVFSSIEVCTWEISRFANQATKIFAADIWQLDTEDQNLKYQRYFHLLVGYITNPLADRPEGDLKAALKDLLIWNLEFPSESRNSQLSSDLLIHPALVALLPAEMKAQITKPDPKTVDPKIASLSRALVQRLYVSETMAQALCKIYQMEFIDACHARMHWYAYEKQIQNRLHALNLAEHLQFLLKHPVLRQDETLQKSVLSMVRATEKLPCCIDRTLKIACHGYKETIAALFGDSFNSPVAVGHDARVFAVMGESILLQLFEKELAPEDVTAIFLCMEQGATLTDYQHYFQTLVETDPRAAGLPCFLLQKGQDNLQVYDGKRIFRPTTLENMIAALCMTDILERVMRQSPIDLYEKIKRAVQAIINWHAVERSPTPMMLLDLQKWLRAAPTVETLQRAFQCMTMYVYTLHLEVLPDCKIDLYFLYTQLTSSLAQHAPEFIVQALTTGSLPLDSVMLIPIRVQQENIETLTLNTMPLGAVLEQFGHETVKQTAHAVSQQQHGQDYSNQTIKIAGVLIDCLEKHSLYCQFPKNKPDDSAVKKSRQCIESIVSFSGLSHLIEAEYTGELIRLNRYVIAKALLKKLLNPLDCGALRTIADSKLQEELELLLAGYQQEAVAGLANRQ